MIVCVYLPRFELSVAAGGPQPLVGEALAIAPELGGTARVGEVSGAAEALGVVPGMALGEALARCPQLRLVPGDPLGVAETWERAARALEGVGAALELARPGLAYFEVDGLRGLHGGDEGAIAAARRALERPARIGAGPTRFCALAAALRVRSRAAVVVEGDGARARRYLASGSVELLGYRARTAALVEPLSRLGVRTLGELAALGGDALADRFGAPGELAWSLACGHDTPLRTRAAQERLGESLELWEASSGQALERVLEALVERLLARPERRGRTLRALTLSARLVEGGTWRERVVLREALSDARRMRLALIPRLGLLPAPAAALRLEAERFGPPEGEQGTLALADPSAGRAARRARLREAVSQVRAAAGPGAALHALCVDPDSRVPERRVVLSPFSG
ncbi:MAG TPA: DNA polymerase Y family protein [Solirubrobacteraceae bacterium]|jgi:protein ImuB